MPLGEEVNAPHLSPDSRSYRLSVNIMKHLSGKNEKIIGFTSSTITWLTGVELQTDCF